MPLQHGAVAGHMQEAEPFKVVFQASLSQRGELWLFPSCAAFKTAAVLPAAPGNACVQPCTVYECSASAVCLLAPGVSGADSCCACACYKPHDYAAAPAEHEELPQRRLSSINGGDEAVAVVNINAAMPAKGGKTYEVGGCTVISSGCSESLLGSATTTEE